MNTSTQYQSTSYITQSFWAIILILVSIVNLHGSERGLWVWDMGPEIIKETEREYRPDFYSFVAAPYGNVDAAITQIFMHFESNNTSEACGEDNENCRLLYEERVREFIADAHSRGLKVQLLFGSILSALKEPYNKPANHIIQAVSNYNRDSREEERFDGIQFDVEPHILGEDAPLTWGKDTAEIWQQFTENLRQWQQTVDDHNSNYADDLLFGAVIPHWFQQDIANHKEVQDIVDYVVIMSYDTRWSGGKPNLFHIIRDELTYADDPNGDGNNSDAMKKSLYAGTESGEIPAKDNITVSFFRHLYLHSISFFYKNNEDLEKTVTFLDEEETIKNSPSFLGTVMHYYEHLRRGETAYRSLSSASKNHAPVVSLINPSGNEVWSKQSFQTIRYQVYDADNDKVKVTLFISDDQGKTWKALPASDVLGDAMAENDGMYHVNPSIYDSGEYRLKIVAQEMKDGGLPGSDASDFSFKIIDSTKDSVAPIPSSPAQIQGERVPFSNNVRVQWEPFSDNVAVKGYFYSSHPQYSAQKTHFTRTTFGYIPPKTADTFPVYIWAVDTSGNLSTTITKTLIIPDDDIDRDGVLNQNDVDRDGDGVSNSQEQQDRTKPDDATDYANSLLEQWNFTGNSWVGKNGTLLSTSTGSPAFIDVSETNTALELSASPSSIVRIDAEKSFLQQPIRSFTVEMWLKPKTDSRPDYIPIFFVGDMDQGFSLFLDTTAHHMTFRSYQNSETNGAFVSANSANTFLFDDNWHHIAAAYNGYDQTIAIFADGNLLAKRKSSRIPASFSPDRWFRFFDARSDFDNDNHLNCNHPNGTCVKIDNSAQLENNAFDFVEDNGADIRYAGMVDTIKISLSSLPVEHLGYYTDGIFQPAGNPPSITTVSPGNASGLGTDQIVIQDETELHEGESASFTVDISANASSYTFQWRFGDAVLTGEESNSLVFLPDFDTVSHPKMQREATLVCMVTNPVTGIASTVTWNTVRVLDVDVPPMAPVVSVFPSSPTTMDDLVASIDFSSFDPDGDTIIGYTYCWTLMEQDGSSSFPVDNKEKSLLASLLEKVKQHLSQETGTPLEDISVISIESVDWNDASLGCPQSGFFYAQVITPGYRIMLEIGETTYIYHTDKQDQYIVCDQKTSSLLPLELIRYRNRYVPKSKNAVLHASQKGLFFTSNTDNIGTTSGSIFADIDAFFLTFDGSISISSISPELTPSVISPSSGILLLVSCASEQKILSSANTKKGQQWILNVRPITNPYGLQDTVSSTVAMANATVVNSVPEISGVTIVTDTVIITTESTLQAIPQGWSDLDNDIPGYSYQWKRNGNDIVGATEATLSNHQESLFSEGDLITVVITPTDREQAGQEIESGTVSVSASYPLFITLSLGNSPIKTLQLGMHQDATDAFDSSFDVPISLPPLPFLNIISLIDTHHDLLLATDIRGKKSFATWLVNVELHNGPVDISWDNIVIPSGTTLAVFEANLIDDMTFVPIWKTGHDMTKDGTLHVEKDSVWMVVFSKSIDITMEFSPGWNLVSFPLMPVPFTASELLSENIQAIWEWDKDDGKRGHYQEADVIVPMKGYWVYALSPSVISFKGIPVKDMAIPVFPGWNLQGPVHNAAIPQTIHHKAWGYDGSTYYAADKLERSKGYWMFSFLQQYLEFYPYLQEDVQVSPDEFFTVGLHQIAILQEEGMKITFSEVVEDSRCPKNVQCIWEGQATITLEIETEAGTTTPLTLNLSEQSIVSFLDYNIEVVSLNLPTVTSDEDSSFKYQIVLMVTKKGEVFPEKK